MSGPSKTRFTIHATEADIERAKRNDSYTCVVVQAIARCIPEAHHIEVDIQTIRFTLHGERLAYLTPYTVQGYIVAFDAGEEIHPFTFQLRDPRKLRRRSRTEAGKAILRAENRRRPTTSKGREVRAKARASKPGVESEVESVKAAYAGEARTRTTAGERVPPRVHKRRQRAYGHRLLRINQEAAV